MHHIVFDGVSIYRVVLPELIALYDAFAAGRPSPLEEPQTTYADYARWEQEWILDSRAARRLGHWHDRLGDLPELALPFDRPRPAAARFRGGVVALTVPADLVDRLRAVGQGAGATLFQVLAASWSLLLGRYAGEQDVVFATAADLRQRPGVRGDRRLLPDTPRRSGSTSAATRTFTELLQRVRNELLDGLDRLVPFERVVRDLDSQTAGAANPVYQTMIVLEPALVAPDPDWSLHQMESEIGDEVGTTKLDLELELDERPEGHLAGRLIYDRDLFDDATAARVAEHWSRIVAAVAADPTQTASRVAILTPAEERRQLVEWNATAAGPRSEGVPDLVRERCAAQPDAPAVTAEGQTVTYGELDARSDATALRLRDAGVTPGDVVALGDHPSIDFVVTALAAVKAGAATLVLDPDLPAERREFMLADSGASLSAGDDGCARHGRRRALPRGA